MIWVFYSNFVAAILKMVNFTVIRPYFSLDFHILREISYKNKDVSIIYS